MRSYCNKEAAWYAACRAGLDQISLQAIGKKTDRTVFELGVGTLTTGSLKWEGKFDYCDTAIGETGKTRVTFTNVGAFAHAVKHACVTAASKDVRYYLQGVCFSPDTSGMTRIAGTDGHRVYFTAVASEGALDREVIIEKPLLAHAAKEIERLVRKKAFTGKAFTDLRVHLASGDSGNVEIELYDSETHNTLAMWLGKGARIDAKFPDINRVVPRDDQLTGSVHFDDDAIDALREYLKTAKTWGDKKPDIRKNPSVVFDLDCEKIKPVPTLGYSVTGAVAYDRDDEFLHWLNEVPEGGPGGLPSRIRFNARYLVEAMDACGASKGSAISLRLSADPSCSGMIETGRGVAIVMPCRL